MKGVPIGPQVLYEGVSINLQMLYEGGTHRSWAAERSWSRVGSTFKPSQHRESIERLFVSFIMVSATDSLARFKFRRT
jgi:hypothetical protein